MARTIVARTAPDYDEIPPVYQLYYYPSNASFAPHACLEEAGAPYELVLVDRAVDGHKAAEYMRLNPSGRIPTLIDGDLVLFETAAICLHIADRHPDSGLAPAPATTERSVLHKWLFYLATTVQAEILVWFYPERYATDDAGIAAVKAGAQVRLAEMLAILDDAIGAGLYLMGEAYTLLDPYLAMLCRWANKAGCGPRDYANLAPYLDRVIARPSMARAIDQEGLTPFV
jgi:glutathione S-transferase